MISLWWLEEKTYPVVILETMKHKNIPDMYIDTNALLQAFLSYIFKILRS